MSPFEPFAKHATVKAAAWIARLRADDRTLEDDREFRQWLDEDPQNAEAFEKINSLWDEIGSLQLDLRTGQPFLESRFSRRKLFLGLGSAVGVGAFVALLDTAQAKTYQTGVGEQKRLILSDGTELFLDTNTKVVTNISSSNRAVALQFGRANFRAGSDTKRPFTVTADREVVTGTQLTVDVSREEDRVSVVLIHGSAVVESTVGGVQSKHFLTDGQQLLATNKRLLKVEKPNLLRLLAWQTGQAVFENDTVTNVVDEMNRYSMLKLEIADNRISNMRVSGVYRVGDNAMFARALSHLLPIELRVANDQIQLLGDDSRLIQG